MASKTQYSPLCNLQSGEYWVLLTILHFLTSLQGFFQQCEYCEVRNVIIEFFTSLMQKKVFQRLERLFPAFVMWKTQYSHILLTVFSHYHPRIFINTQTIWGVVDITIQEFSLPYKIIFQ